jgi:hypothetical protein
MAEFHAYSNFDTEMGKIAKEHLKRRAVQAALAARFHVGVDQNGPHPGLLKSTIRADGRATKGAAPGTYQIHIRAGSARANYALKHHQGFSPYSVREGEVMAFPSRGRTVYTTSIDHPGFKGNPFLVQGARDVMAADGAGVVHYKNVRG